MTSNSQQGIETQYKTTDPSQQLRELRRRQHSWLCCDPICQKPTCQRPTYKFVVRIEKVHQNCNEPFQQVMPAGGSAAVYSLDFLVEIRQRSRTSRRAPSPIRPCMEMLGKLAALCSHRKQLAKPHLLEAQHFWVFGNITVSCLPTSFAGREPMTRRLLMVLPR